MSVTIAVIVGVLGVGLAASQLLRLRTWLSRPSASDEAPPADPDDPTR